MGTLQQSGDAAGQSPEPSSCRVPEQRGAGDHLRTPASVPLLTTSEAAFFLRVWVEKQALEPSGGRELSKWGACHGERGIEGRCRGNGGDGGDGRVRGT